MKPALDSMKQRLLRLKLSMKRKKPEFLRHLWWKFPKFINQYAWRKPKGLDNKMRLKLKGYPPIVSVGYRSPRAVRGLHPSGFKPVVVHNVKELESLDPSIHIVYIASNIGFRKRVQILEKAKSMGFRIANEV